MKPAMPNFDEQDIVLLQRIKRHPLLRARVESLLGVVEDAGGDLEKAAAAERRVIDELRQMGNEVLTECARGGIDKCEAQSREDEEVRSGGKKTPLAYDLRRTGGGGLPGDISAVAAGAGRLRRGPCVRSRPGQVAGTLRHRHAGEHDPVDHRTSRAMPV